jgi:hypothetical protein
LVVPGVLVYGALIEGRSLLIDSNEIGLGVMKFKGVCFDTLERFTELIDHGDEADENTCGCDLVVQFMTPSTIFVIKTNSMRSHLSSLHFASH